MNLKYIAPLIGSILTVGIIYIVKNKMNKDREGGTLLHSLAQAGAPDQLEASDEAQIENANMVSEGSQFGVQYFNKMSKDDIEKWSEKNN